LARAIHNRSNPFIASFVRINCAAVSSVTIATELFGHEKGAFTGAVQRRVGRFELATVGIFLDEIGDLPPETQITLLRVLQEREFERVGGGQPISVDVRVLAATNRDLNVAIAADMSARSLLQAECFSDSDTRAPRTQGRHSILLEYFIDGTRESRQGIKTISKRTLELFRRMTGQATFANCRTWWSEQLYSAMTIRFLVDESCYANAPR